MKTPEYFSPHPDRNHVIKTIRESGLESPKAQEYFWKYFEYLCSNAETQTGRGNIEVYIEVGKIYAEAGLLYEAIELFTEPEAGIINATRNLGFSDLVENMWNLIDTWQSNNS